MASSSASKMQSSSSVSVPTAALNAFYQKFMAERVQRQVRFTRQRTVRGRLAGLLITSWVLGVYGYTIYRFGSDDFLADNTPIEDND